MNPGPLVRDFLCPKPNKILYGIETVNLNGPLKNAHWGYFRQFLIPWHFIFL